MKKNIIFINSFLFLMSVSAFAAGYKLDSTASFSLSAISLTFFVAVFCVSVLDYKVGGSQLSLEKRVVGLEKQNDDLREVATALLKSVYVLSHGSSLWDGPSESHMNLVNQYLGGIKDLNPENIRKEVNEDLKDFTVVEDNA